MATRMIDLRAATLPDCDALAAIHGEAWLGAYRGLLDGIELQRLIARRNPAWWKGALQRGVQIKLLEISDTPAGYATYGTSRLRSVPSEGEIYELYLRPEYQGLGFGRQLFEAVRADLNAHCLQGLAVQVLTDNEPAVGFYTALGGQLTETSTYHNGGRPLGLSVFTWSAV
ncbi:GNAT family N-acetyltransferase [Roseibium sediminis]|uniref:GNAT family N-acetyltransferase n=1 Tax=Roseibium sediminis TaxID=1775174 RepID=UPI00123E2987|nr:N-acetyltransferase [Roseibium sediminis]